MFVRPDNVRIVGEEGVVGFDSVDDAHREPVEQPSGGLVDEASDDHVTHSEESETAALTEPNQGGGAGQRTVLCVFVCASPGLLGLFNARLRRPFANHRSSSCHERGTPC